MHHDHKTLAKEMRKIKELLDSLDLPLRSIITDHQEGLIKGIAEVWPLVTYIKELFPEAIHTIDVFHVTEYLWDAGNCLYTCIPHLEIRVTNDREYSCKRS